jgi:hypothetical protein
VQETIARRDQLAPERVFTSTQPMSSPRFEHRQTRQALLQTFARCLGEPDRGHFTTESLGLWATYLSAIGLDPRAHASIRHVLLECGFLNVAFDGTDIDARELVAREAVARASGADCLMVPCVRTSDCRPLLEQGYVPVQTFFDCRATIRGPWEDHVRRVCKPRAYLNLQRQMRLLAPHYRTEWVTLGELVRDRELFDRACAIYLGNARKFAHPAIHFSREVMLALADGPYASDFWVALTHGAAGLVKLVVCFIDPGTRYLAFLVQGIDYDAVPTEHNLYNHIYVSIYELMHERGLEVFDMGRGFVEQKVRLGCNVVEPLHTYLKPLGDGARAYVARIRSHAERLRLPERARPYVTPRALVCAQGLLSA